MRTYVSKYIRKLDTIDVWFDFHGVYMYIVDFGF